jgi:hypothetical protein
MLKIGFPKKQQGRKDRKYKKMITPSDGDIKTKHKKNYHKGISSNKYAKILMADVVNNKVSNWNVRDYR